MNGKRMGMIYFVVHFLVEVVCFALTSRQLGFGYALLLGFLYDFLAFVPQGAIGFLNAAFPKLDIGSIGSALMFAGVLVYSDVSSVRGIFSIVLIAIGNAFLHECGAVATVVWGEGKLCPAAVFVAGGSFGVAVGKYMGTHMDGVWPYIVAILLIEVLVLLTNKYWLGSQAFPSYHLVKTGIAGEIVIVSVVAITAVRSYIAYAIPMSWNKQWWQTFLLFFMMGIGKGLGGFVSDRIGAKKTGIITSLLAIPFLICGENWMVVSIVGVLIFSMTMSITYAMALSVLGNMPGAAFGVTTVGLFLGMVPEFVFDKPPVLLGNAIVIVLSVFAAVCFWITGKDGKEE